MLVEKLTEHYNQEPSEIMEWYKFFTSQKVWRDHSSLARTCKFGDMLNVMLRDRLVYSVDNNSI